MASEMQAPHDGQPCGACARGKYQVPLNRQEWHVECDYCGAVYFVYKPMEHQEAFHRDMLRYKYGLFAGGYGSSKTTTGGAQMIKHSLETKNGMTLIGAATLPQLEQTAQKQYM